MVQVRQSWKLDIGPTLLLIHSAFRDNQSVPIYLPKVYPITDVHLSGLSHAEQVKRLAAGGARLIQLREKHASTIEFYEAARSAMAVARSLGVDLVINDRVDIAVAVKANGVHLGQDDLPPDSARLLMGASGLIGYSTHTPAQALEADSLPVNYIAFGPIFSTSTKGNPDPAVGIEALRSLTQKITKPVVAIGGITLNNLALVLAAGAASAAIISGVIAAQDITGRFKALKAAAGEVSL